MEKTEFKRVLSCTDCRFHDKVVNQQGMMQTICRINPPVVAYGIVPQPHGQVGMLSQSAWPIMQSGDWCARIEVGEPPNADKTQH